MAKDIFALLKEGSTTPVFKIRDTGSIRTQSAVQNVTDATLTVTAEEHAGKIITLNLATGIAVTLPVATGAGDVFRFYVGTTFTSPATIKVPDASGTMSGVLGVATDAAGVNIPTAATTDTISMNGSTTGGLLGSYIELVDVAANKWLVSGALVSTGAEATPFSATV